MPGANDKSRESLQRVWGFVQLGGLTLAGTLLIRRLPDGSFPPGLEVGRYVLFGVAFAWFVAAGIVWLRGKKLVRAR
jgi:hypothetical protein